MPLLFFLGAWNICFAKANLGLVIGRDIDELSTIKVDIEGKTGNSLVSAAQAPDAIDLGPRSP